ncbi:DNA adenine methylase [Pseudactinotalea terrae]|uniref:DNA adenine methylase n=1 Tax=Pseudactinotalea terrae TaxID=1743262 RepID=UPI0012E201D4|nr:DNA adenine methylase [Pseudactinotalea terrae]
MSARRYLSPLRYPGGKARMAGRLADIFAGQVSLLEVEVWIEPFAGGAGAGLHLLETGAVSEVWLTEKHPALAAMWATVLAEPEQLARRVESTMPDLDLWTASLEAVGAAMDGTWAGERFELAFAALVVNRCSRSGIVAPRVGPIGGKQQSGPWTIASRWNGDGLASRIRHLGTLAGRIRFTEGEAVTTIADLDGSGIEEEVMLLVDPPYLREGNRLYANGMTEVEHRELARVLNASPARWLLTYDDEDVVAQVLYPHRRVLAYQIPNTANRARIATEHAVLSDNLWLPPDTVLLPGSSSTWVRQYPIAA